MLSTWRRLEKNTIQLAIHRSYDDECNKFTQRKTHLALHTLSQLPVYLTAEKQHEREEGTEERVKQEAHDGCTTIIPHAIQSDQP